MPRNIPKPPMYGRRFARSKGYSSWTFARPCRASLWLFSKPGSPYPALPSEHGPAFRRFRRHRAITWNNAKDRRNPSREGGRFLIRQSSWGGAEGSRRSKDPAPNNALRLATFDEAMSLPFYLNVFQTNVLTCHCIQEISVRILISLWL